MISATKLRVNNRLKRHTRASSLLPQPKIVETNHNPYSGDEATTLQKAIREGSKSPSRRPGSRSQSISQIRLNSFKQEWNQIPNKRIKLELYFGNQLMDQHLSMKQGDFKTHYLSVIQNTLLDDKAGFYKPFKLTHKQKPADDATPQERDTITPLPHVNETPNAQNLHISLSNGALLLDQPQAGIPLKNWRFSKESISSLCNRLQNNNFSMPTIIKMSLYKFKRGFWNERKNNNLQIEQSGKVHTTAKNQ